MANFNVGVNPTPDPTYTNSSRGTDNAALQPLASIPDLSTKYVQPQYEANKTAGKAIESAGSLAEAGIKLTDAVIQEKANQTLTKGINDIRDSFGVAQASEKGSKLGEAVGAAGAEGVSLTDPQTNQPVALNRLGTKVSGLTEAYQQGALSNSAYYAKLEAFVRETKAQFPGYSDQIDSMVATKVGTTPANALRSALQQDVANLQNKVMAQNDKWTTYEHAKSDIIHIYYPDYEQRKAEGKAPTRLEVEATVGKHESQIARMDFKLKTLAVKSGIGSGVADDAYQIALEKASELSRTTVIGTTNAMGIRDANDLRKYVEDINAGRRKAPSPDELQQITGMFSILEQKVAAQFDEFANKPLSDNTTETVASRLRDPTKLGLAKQAALSDLTTLKEGILGEKHGLVAHTIMWNRANDALAGKNLAIRFPDSQVMGALRNKIGDNAMSSLVVNDQILPDMLRGIQGAGWAAIDQDQSARSWLDQVKYATQSPDKPGGDGAAIKTHLDNARKMVIEKDKLADPTLGDKAFKHLYGPDNRTLIDSFRDKAQVSVFTDLVSPAMTKAVAKRSKEDQTTFVHFAEDGFTSVFQTQAMGANETANNYKYNGNLSIKYNPDAQQFEFTGKAPAGLIGSANSRLQPLNSAIASMKDVFKLTGKNPTGELYRLLPIAGIEPGSPIYKAIQSEFLKSQPKETGSGD